MPASTTKRPRGANYSDDESVSLSSSDKENSANRRQRKSKKRAKESSPGQADLSSTQFPSTQGGHGKAFYDPEQQIEERRKVRREMRALGRSVADNKTNFVHGDSRLLMGSIKASNRLFKNVKQTSDATIDSGNLLGIAEGGLKRLQNMDIGNGTVLGIDTNDFLNKIKNFMNSGPNPSERNDGHFDWAYLGRKIIQTVVKRPPVTPFMYGPLSIQKKVRHTQRARRERLRYDEADKVRPTELKDDEIKAAEQTTPILVQEVHECLTNWVLDNTDEGLDIFLFIINPNSFGQSVENLFYLSFLVRDGRAAVTDYDGGSKLRTTVAEPLDAEDEDNYEKKPRKHIIISFNMAKWQKYIDEFNITEPIIPHRDTVWKGPKFAEIDLGGAWAEDEPELEPLQPLEDFMKGMDIEDFNENEQEEEDPEILEIFRKYGGLALAQS
ncbi:Nse4-domain-containing protein [Ascobolus immersus RN42]|uniref:Non-structural maintenance of chromosomes element 4 n=1 Tax=Ascobolus immersus RN42 TaxID=1160509 RepID=A0A3N4IB32_ASCIM|nr:Nse4-domain-containing protein [Ascobolus immersus RN42]